MNTTALPSPSVTLLRDLYERMLLTRVVDAYLLRLQAEGRANFVASCRGHEAAQVGSALCIEVGRDFTLPYYRDLGVVLTIGMTPYEVFRTCLQNNTDSISREDGLPLPPHAPLDAPSEDTQHADAHNADALGARENAREREEDARETDERAADALKRVPPHKYSVAHAGGNDVQGRFSTRRGAQPVQHWGYHKHNTISGPAPVATQILHAAGIAFASKLRRADAVTVAYCGDGATAETDFREGIAFAAQQSLPAVFICEADAESGEQLHLSRLALPEGLTCCRIDGRDILTVYAAMREAMALARGGRGPVLLEMRVTRSEPGHDEQESDPLAICRRHLEERGACNDAWARQAYARIEAETLAALEDALRDTRA